MAVFTKPAMNRYRIRRALLLAGLSVILTSDLLQATGRDEPVRALDRYPYLADAFPYGFWHGQAPHDERLAGEFREPSYAARREKLFHHLARHHVNAIVTANRLARPESLAAAGKYGIGQISCAGNLHSHVTHSGKLTGELTMEQVLEQVSDHARTVRDLPHLLAYLVYDEPRAAVAPKIQQVLDAVRLADPNHPAIYTHSDMPLDRQNDPIEWRMLESQDVLLSDCYAIAARSGRDPWLYGDVYIRELRRANPDALQWPIVQAFTKPYDIWALPTPAELRVQVYHTIAAGAKGMFFFTTNQAYLGAWSRRHWFYRGSGNPWYGKEELMEEIGRIGAHLTTAGPLLIPLRYAPDYPTYVGDAGSPFDPSETFHAHVLGASSESGDGGLRRNDELERPAIHVGAFSGADYDVLVIHNDDPWNARTAAVTIDTQRENVFDLATLERVPLTRSARGITFGVSFDSGDGRLYLAGDDAAVDAARTRVLRRRYEHQALMLKLDAEVAHRGGVDIGPANKLLERAGEAGDPATALGLVQEAAKAFRGAEAAHRDYASVRVMLESARDNFSYVYDWFNSSPVYPQGNGSILSLARLEERVIPLSRFFSRVENAFREGKLNVTDAYVLRRQTAAYKADALAYRPEGLLERSIAVVELVPEEAATPDPEARALAKWLRWMFTDVSHLKALPDGRFIDAAGAAADPAGQEVVWVHAGGRSTAVRARYCVSASLAPGVPAAPTVAGLRKFMDAGGGMVLSGLATCLAPDLGLEAYPPNQCYWGSMIVPGHGPSRHRSAARPSVKSLGLKPLVPDHRIFADLPAGGFQTMEFNAAELVTEAVWQRPPGEAKSWREPEWPQEGRVLAGYWADGVEIPDNHAAVVEYETANGGRVILLGGAFDPRICTNRPRRGPHYDQLIRNVVAHCSGKEQEPAPPAKAMVERVIESDHGPVNAVSLLQWQFALDEGKRGMDQKWYATDFDDARWSPVRTDLDRGWQPQGFAGGDADAFGWYRLRIKTPSEFAGKKVYLVFEAVDEDAHVYINGTKVFEHSCNSTGLKPSAIWLTPFAFEAGSSLRPGEEDLLAVAVYNRAGMGGIYRPVCLVAVDAQLDVQTLLGLVRR